MEDQRSCVFCEALTNRKSALENTELLGSQHFVVIPALGPLTVGHAMIVSRKHYPSLASLGATGLSEYQDLVNQLRRSAPSLLGSSLEAEHGGTHLDPAGACIAHAHINLVPSSDHLADMLDGKLEPISGVATLMELGNLAEPYVCFGRPARYVCSVELASRRS